MLRLLNSFLNYLASQLAQQLLETLQVFSTLDEMERNVYVNFNISNVNFQFYRTQDQKIIILEFTALLYCDCAVYTDTILVCKYLIFNTSCYTLVNITITQDFFLFEYMNQCHSTVTILENSFGLFYRPPIITQQKTILEDKSNLFYADCYLFWSDFHHRK